MGLRSDLKSMGIVCVEDSHLVHSICAAVRCATTVTGKWKVWLTLKQITDTWSLQEHACWLTCGTARDACLCATYVATPERLVWVLCTAAYEHIGESVPEATSVTGEWKLRLLWMGLLVYMWRTRCLNVA